MRIKTLPEAITQILVDDPETSLNLSMLSTLIEQNQLKCYMHGNRRVVDYDTLVENIKQMLDIKGDEKFPKVRTIKKASREVSILYPEIGIGEAYIRNCAKDGVIASIQVGNRFYISLNSFEGSFIPDYDANKIASNNIKQKVMEQMDFILSCQTGIPKIKRVRT